MKKALLTSGLLLLATNAAFAQTTARLDSTVARDNSYDDPRITVTHYAYAPDGVLAQTRSETYALSAPDQRTPTERQDYFTASDERGQVKYTWDSDKQAWRFVEGSYKEVDENDGTTVLATQDLIANADTTGYRFSSRTEYTYDEGGRLTSKSYFINPSAPPSWAAPRRARVYASTSRDTISWTPYLRYEYSFFANGAERSIAEYDVDQSTGQFKLNSYVEWDKNGDIINRLEPHNYNHPKYWEKYETVVDQDSLTATTYYSVRYEGEADFTLYNIQQIVYADSIGGRILSQRKYAEDGTIAERYDYNYIFATITIGDETAVNHVAADGQTVRVVGRKITTRGARHVTVHNAAGQLISTNDVTPVEPGIYIVQADGKTIKVVVK